MRLIFAALVAAFSFQVQAQYDHSRGHNEYQNWASGKVKSCCNNQDCRGLSRLEIREGDYGPEILIDGQWCPVWQEHYLIRGKSPDWSVPHACIQKTRIGCDRLLCFSPEGGF